MQELLKNYNFHENEQKWQLYWLQHNIYVWDQDEARENSFIVDTPPPTVSGQLHIGHVYSYTQTDFIVRFQRMMGKNIFYPIGFDDNGLPTERLVEKQKQVKASLMERKEFIELCKQVVTVEEEKFRSLFRQIALSVDWTLEYQTINPLSQQISQMSFLDLAAKDEVFRDQQPMLWDPVDQTALAQADIEDKEKSSFMNDVVFYTDKGEQLIIATTRPEMLAACVAVLFHPDDSRYQHLQNQYAITPLFEVKVPIIADELVQPDKGSGLVMCCTFGDITDIKWWQKHQLPLKIIINKFGQIADITFDSNCQNIHKATDFANELQGLKIVAARTKIIEILKTANLLIAQKEITHTVKCAERSGALLEILTTDQWFIKTLQHKETMLARSNQLNWYPKSMKIRLDNWINSIAWDWCISRQRYFGVPFPVWYSKRAGEEGKILFANIAQLPVDPLTDLPEGYSKDEVEPDRDVMDTWATSSVSPQLATHAISKQYAVDWERHLKLFPADLRPQAHEILRTWAFYTILKSHLHQDSLPWNSIMISGWCLASDRSKMSKSKDNVISPEKLLQEYGADVIRYWAATSKLGADTAYSEDIMKNGKRLVNKLWNAAKFVSTHFDKLSSTDLLMSYSEIKHKITHPLDQWLINNIVDLTISVQQAMQNYEYASALHAVEQFFWSRFCDNYLEITKVRAYNEEGTDTEGQQSTILTLYHSLQIILKLFAPFIPHITEEIYSILYHSADLTHYQKSIHARGSWPDVKGWKFITENDNNIENLLIILALIRSAKTAKNLSVKAPIKLLEVTGCSLSPSLTQDLANVVTAEIINYVDNFSTKNGHQLDDRHLAVSIIYKI
ncbi:Valine--tRNA ligase [Candidatus Trichorickettsia mobilis]|uniref:Valine--tRNA ligase n=1 Tax=Candidatus Trichorickettsia mobilis TaxID=1346319 RepID=A0ABZ0UTN3_9RICK|nr:valine--tRNA ligase [Candidatus Trichorickettsia mobilis]WPY00550.1 Valine--tRNA ligase [Candidatus Trichorickettsia mobilis]